MSIFDYPRLHFKGTLSLSPGTANNDDYAGGYNLLPESVPEGPPQEFVGSTLALIDSKQVQPRTYGMSDEEFIEWVQKAQTFETTSNPGETREIIPAEWNYYGAMGMSVDNVQVISVQTSKDDIHTVPGGGLTELIGSDVSFVRGHITDVNCEGSPPATQFFIDQLKLEKGDSIFLDGPASKGTGLWINFYRNVNLRADSGAGSYVYHVVKKEEAADFFDNIPEFSDAAGVIFRYYLYRSEATQRGNAQIEELYENKKSNPATLEIVGTFAPWYADEEITSMPVGRLMVSNDTNIPTPGRVNNGGDGGPVALAPAVLQRNGNIISADFVGTFPDDYQDPINPKFDFGPVSLVVSNGELSATIGTVDYANTESGDRKGWIFEFDISANDEAQRILQSSHAFFRLTQGAKVLLSETKYYFVTNQLAVYAEQHGSGTTFLNQGPPEEPATLSVYHRGEKLSPDECPPITVWQYQSTPLQSPGDAEVLYADFKPGDQLEVDTCQPGNLLFTFTIDQIDPPAANYGEFSGPPFITITSAPYINLRILPNNEDFSQYYVDPSAQEPVGNELLTFDVVFEKVLRTYYLLYPAMNHQAFFLNNYRDVSDNANYIIPATDPSRWMFKSYMPPTRDMSASRATLLRAWCRNPLPPSPPVASSTKSGQFAVDSSQKDGTLFTNDQASEVSVTFTASGTWKTAPGSKYNYGPEGKSGSKNKKAQYPDSTLYALVAVNSNNEVVGEGANITLTLQPNESVSFKVNDTHYANNRGQLTVGWFANLSGFDAGSNIYKTESRGLMTNTNTNKYRRLGGPSTRRLSHHPGQRLIDQIETAEAQLLTPQELTGELWSELEGTWVGNKGWNIIAMPAPGTTPDFSESDGSSILIVQPYMERLTFTNPGAPARNRGGDRDQFVPALEYHQRVSHLETGELLHVENGMFLNLSTIVGNPTKNILPSPKFNIARSGTIPHGNSIMILGGPPSVEPGAPDIPDISSFPFFRKGDGGRIDFDDNDPYLSDYQTHESPPNVPNPNETLRQELLRLKEQGGSIISTTTMTLDSIHHGGVTNIPFIVKRANATRVSATFWLEKVRNSDGIEFLQLQYSQTILLKFHHFKEYGPILIWPHITINTLVKQ